MNAIVAVDANWSIGCGGKLLYYAPEDIKYFKHMTQGKVVVMGRKTFLSLPGSKPLPNRTNIVLTSDKSFRPESVIVCGSVENMLEAVSAYSPDDVFIIGGEDVYTQMLSHCSRVYVTKFHGEKPADRYFPNLDKMDNWVVEGKSEDKEYNGLKFAFYTYVNSGAG
jgi:dihydrofolate reductase